MNDLEKYFRENNKRLINKWSHYFEIYDRHFSKYRGKEVTILEIGVSHGGSLQMWKNYFGNNTIIYGIDIDHRCKQLEEENIKIFIGSQQDKNFLNRIKDLIPKVDILIDDGGHTMKQQIITFEALFDHVKDDGIYLCEDIHTSYWLKFGGGYKRRGTFIEYSKNLIDYLNAFHSEQKRLKVNRYTQTINSLHFYDSVLVIEKRNRIKPTNEWSGNFSFDINESNKSFFNLAINKIRRIFLTIINKILRFFYIKGFIWR